MLRYELKVNLCVILHPSPGMPKFSSGRACHVQRFSYLKLLEAGEIHIFLIPSQLEATTHEVVFHHKRTIVHYAQLGIVVDLRSSDKTL